MNNRYLTKSRFKLALDCPRKLFYTNKPEYGNIKEEDDFLQALAEGGYQVGELAKLYYPNGHDITESGYAVPLARTNQLLQQENVIIYEAAIQYKNLFIRVDILKKQGNKIELIEVKAKSFNSQNTDTFTNNKGFIIPGWKPYLYDVAFQKYVLSKALPQFQIDSYLMLADKAKITSIDGLNQKIQLVKNPEGRIEVQLLGNTSLEALGNPILSIIQINELVENIHNGTDNKDLPEIPFEKLIWKFAKAYENNEKLQCQIGAHCANCEFKSDNSHEKSGFKECWQEQTRLTEADFNKPLIFEMWNFRGKQKCIDEGNYLLADLVKEDVNGSEPQDGQKLLNTQRQWLQIKKEKYNDNTVYINRIGLKQEMDKHVYPLHFIDFETSMVAIPFYKNSTPYEQIAFQYSHHTMQKDGTVRHQSEFLATEKGLFPNFEFIRALKADLEKDNGSIFRFADHENTVLNQIKQQLIEKTDIVVNDRDDLIEFIDSITHSTNEQRVGQRDMIDMCQIAKDYYYDPYTKGSNSIKAILPAVLQRSNYIQSRYQQPIYGKDCEIESKNFIEPQVWIQKDAEGKIISPYKLLPELFSGIPKNQVAKFMTDDNLSGGGAALTAYAKMQFTEMSEIERELVIKGLLRYCELDTLAMVIIYEYWLNELKHIKEITNKNY
jgi:hypothetical protein